LKGKESAYRVAEQFGVSHTMIYKIWSVELRPIDSPKETALTNESSDLLAKFVTFFILPEVAKAIPRAVKQDFLAKLTPNEKLILNKLVGGNS
jgi:hypothetical protein